MQKNWYRLDTAALIFPAITRSNWSNAFRFSVTLHEEIDPYTLQHALDDLRPRFPSFFLSLHKGFFWYYLEDIEEPIRVQEDFAYPLTFMRQKELKKHCLRVLYYKNRIAVEIFHSLTDGHGGSIFIANLTRHYLEIRHGITIPAEGAIYDLAGSPTEEELEDSFLKYAAPAAAGRNDTPAYHLRGTTEDNGFRHLTTGIVDTGSLIEAAHAYKVSVTAFLSAVMAESIIRIQDEKTPKKRQKPVKVTIPVDMRRLFGSGTLRNFVLAINPGVEPKFGYYTLAELCQNISHQLAIGATRQNMAGMIAANVEPQRITAIRLAPVFIKNPIMDLIYQSSGENPGSISISNITKIDLPEAMLPYMERMEFIIGPQRSYPNNCSVISFGGKTYINMIRNIKESELERLFFSRLVELGIPVDIESNDSSIR